MLRLLLPGDREAAGLLVLLLVHEARRATRTDSDGRLLRLEEQDRSAWDREQIAEADRLLVETLRAGPPGRFTVQAAIAALHAQAPSYDATDWPQILTLYDLLLQIWPSPVAALNRAVALAMVDGPEAALAEVEALERDGRLTGYRYLPSTQGRPAAPPRPRRRGRDRLPGRARALRQHGRAGVPRAAPLRALTLSGSSKDSCAGRSGVDDTRRWHATCTQASPTRGEPRRGTSRGSSSRPTGCRACK